MVEGAVSNGRGANREVREGEGQTRSLCSKPWCRWAVDVLLALAPVHVGTTRFVLHQLDILLFEMPRHLRE
jgi:hypothetical protein